MFDENYGEVVIEIHVGERAQDTATTEFYEADLSGDKGFRSQSKRCILGYVVVAILVD